MTQDPHPALTAISPVHSFFIGIDSDGCVFDTMEIKHKECFCPNFIRYWDLQTVSKYARETWDFVNLYSQTRGCNRFHAVIESMRLLEDRKEVQARGLKLHDLTPLQGWVEKETKLGNPALERYAAAVHDPIIDRTLQWTIAVNRSIEDMVHGIPPFPFVRESLARMEGQADVMVISQTPGEALEREWNEHNIAHHALAICGQEYGTKTEHLKYGAKGKYADDRILMIGDAPGDLKAAKANGVLFYPIIPGQEERSWEQLLNTGLTKFYGGEYAGEYENALISEFDRSLPDTPGWE